MLSQLGYLVSRRFHHALADFGIEPRHFALMRAIEDIDGPPQSAVSERLHIPPSTMVALVDALEARGLIQRRPHATDRRSRALYITDAGFDLLDRATEVAIGVERAVCAGLTDGERVALVGLLQRVARNLDAIAGVHPGLTTDDPSNRWGDRPADE
jgi:DNA-binding MarR family transcriptional regulator